ncbi:hypothetical protein [Streptacidiphilus fuscans]|uniref:Uncharacterized protein n=1 Tax=Streptacidiphilus fuscans TaxID=2789292 RepID=A0A931BCC4_9ACTN|nr:hypothetical protein [Streptacidiphilus fuscans]MBF9072657.1 hypothetical protein [Streptacidiphilus fuscans]
MTTLTTPTPPTTLTPPTTSTTLRRRVLVLTAVATAAAVALCGPTATATADSAASDALPTVDGPAVPVAQAYDGNTLLPSTQRVTDFCGAHANACRFVIDRAASSEYLTAVKSLGNAVINCTSSPITLTRDVSMDVSNSDNLGGEITGQITVQGQLSGSAAVTAGVSGEAGGNFKTPDQSKGPSAEVNAKGGANGSGALTGSASLSTAFQGAFKLAYNKTWSTDQKESTTYQVTVLSGDALMFGASAAMRRIAGGIFVGNGMGIKNVYVDGPSSVNNSTFVAETYTVPNNTCTRLRPDGKTGNNETTPPPTKALPPGGTAMRGIPTRSVPPRSTATRSMPTLPSGLIELPGGLPAGSRLTQQVALPGGRR